MADFAAVSAAALWRAETLIPLWLASGKRRGHEWVCGNLQGDAGESCSVNLTSGKWGDFSTGEKGGDLVSLYAAIHNLSQSDACEELSKQFALNGHAGAPVVKTPERSAEQVPGDAPDPPQLSDQTALYWYHDASGARIFAIVRLDSPDGKSFRQWTWRGGKWAAKAYPSPRPLYGLADLMARSQLPVLVVEGEKCRDSASAALSAYAVVSWAGGAQAAKSADWAALADRDVILWPDADEPGIRAMVSIAETLLPISSRLRIIKPEGQTDGWDVSDAIHAGWSAEKITQWARERITEVSRPAQSGEPKKGRKHDGQAPIESAPTASSLVSWQSLGLECNSGGIPFPTIANVQAILTQHPRFATRIWFDDFRGKIMCDPESGPARPWTDADDLFLVAFIQNNLKISKLGLQTVMHGVQLTAFANRRNSVAAWLDALVWDQTERLQYWVNDYLGVPRTAYSSAAGRNWLISMAARAYLPGCQADHMPVLEGVMGRGKSSAISILGGEWYRAAPQAFGSKEFLEAIQGAWLIEIPDMVGFGRREHSQIISAITTRSDAYRASYGRHSEEHPRSCVFAATSETDDYLQDSRGVRRYWPLRCADINLKALASSRDQLFAEAVHAFKAGATWHEMPVDETTSEQLERQETDPWLDAIQRWTSHRTKVVVTDIAFHCLDIEVAKLDRSVQMRVARCLKYLGFENKVEKLEGRPIRVYRRAA